MSVIGIIAVHQCDGCKQTAIVHTQEDWASYSTNWFAGFDLDYCPDCKDKIEHQSAIAENEVLIDDSRSYIEANLKAIGIANTLTEAANAN